MGKEYEIKFKLGAETDSSFSRAFSAASSDFKQLQTQIRDLSRGGVNKGVLGSLLDPLRRNMRQTRADAKKTASAAEEMFGMIKKVGVGVAGYFGAQAAIGFGKDTINTFANFEQGMANVRAVSGLDKTSNDFQLLTAKAREMGATTSKTATEAADGLQYLALAGWSTKQMLTGIEPVLRLSEAGNLDLGRASDLVTDSMAALGIQVKDLPGYLDQVAQVSRKSNTNIDMLMESFLVAGGSFKTFNVPLEEASSLLGIMANRGYKGSEAGTAMNAIITNLTSGMGQAGTAMKELGLSAFDSKGRFKGMEKVFLEVKGKIDKMTDSQKAQYIAMIAGKEHLKTFTGLLDGLGKEYGGLKKEVSAADGALNEMSETQMDTLSGSMKSLDSAIESAKISLGEILAPTVRGVVDDITTWAPRAMGELETLMDGSAWKNADLIGKMHLAWDKIIGDPLDAWWESSGRQQVGGVAKEIGKMVWSGISGLAEESLGVFTGSPTGILAAGALAVPAAKVTKSTRKVIKGLTGMGKAGAEAASTMGLVTRSTGLLAPAFGAILNPVGLTAVGVGLLAGGWLAYKQHQEKARQELLNMKGALDGAFQNYHDIDTQSRKTSDLIKEYDRLKDKINDVKTPAEELAEARRKLEVVEQQLIDLNPDIIKAEDAKKDIFREEAEYADKLGKHEQEMARRKVEVKVMENRDKLPELRQEKKKSEAERDKYEATYQEDFKKRNQLSDLKNRLVEVQSKEKEMEPGALKEQLDKLIEEYNAITGNQLDNRPDLIRQAADEASKIYEDNFNKYKQAYEDAKKFNESIQAVYDDEKHLLEINSGLEGSIEKAAEKYKKLPEEGKQSFRDLLQQFTNLNNKLNDLPKNLKVDVDLLYKTAGLPVFIGPPVKPHAWGGYIDRPHLGLVGEAGPEMIVPLSPGKRARGLDLWERAGRMLGVRSDAFGGNGGAINIPEARALEVGKEADQLAAFGARAYAQGGFITTPHLGLVGEAGPEAIIPLSAGKRDRGLALWERAGNLLGVHSYADGGLVGGKVTMSPSDWLEKMNHIMSDTGGEGNGIYVTWSPQITVQGGGGSNVKQEVSQALKEAQNDFERRFHAMLRQQGRVVMQ